MFDKLRAMEEERSRLEKVLADAEVISDRARYDECVRKHGQLKEAVDKFQDYKRVLKQMEESKSILEEKGEDKELISLAHSELKGLEKRKAELEVELRSLLRPERREEECPAMVEIRAGTGGEEACLFAGDLFHLYCKYAEGKGWKVEVMSSHPSGRGGFKEIIFGVEGKGVHHRLKYEGGVHRVQRVPVTESQGRIHTSTVTVAVLPEAKEIELKIDPEELRIDTFRSSGPGGQHVNVTDSAVRIRHLPTGIVVQCQDEKSQHKNRAKAMRVLRARLLRYLKEKEEAKISDARRAQVGKAKRSEKIRTYNFPQGRVTDHRIGLTLHKLDEVLKGNLDKLIDALAQKLERD
ncbi:peptide chain release factor 1 [candidate division NPL-UPA2 bacterium]|nr:peptide chain release factor 1 [candidate division NPL-UPA2 bacterium]